MKAYQAISPSSPSRLKNYSRLSQSSSPSIASEGLRSATSADFLIPISNEKNDLVYKPGHDYSIESPNQTSATFLRYYRRRFIFPHRKVYWLILLIFILLGFRKNLRQFFNLTSKTRPEFASPKEQSEKEALGLENKSYRSIGSTDWLEYQREVFGFFDSFLSHSPYKEDLTLRKVLAEEKSIPKIIHQTGPAKIPSKSVELTIEMVYSWKLLNPEHQYNFLDDWGSNSWILSHFSRNSEILNMWKAFALIPVIRSDLYRYLTLIRSGGIYTDLDTFCLKPINVWDKWKNQPAGQIDHKIEKSPVSNSEHPQIIIGIEADVGNRTDWSQWWPRPIQIAQWTIASIPQHPILIDTVRRIYKAYQDPNSQKMLSTLENQNDPSNILRIVGFTGPGPFTDSVLRYIKTISFGEVEWSALKDLPPQGLKIGDCLILPISAFSPGIKSMGAEEVDYEGAYVHHQFAGSWKPQEEEVQDTETLKHETVQ